MNQQTCDFHHLLFQERYWQTGFARRLREHPYMKKRIPQGTLHSLIHSKIHDIPVPNGKECKRAFFYIDGLYQKKLIDPRRDPLTIRLDLLIELWQDTCPATVAILKWQRDLIAKYEQAHPDEVAAYERRLDEEDVNATISQLRRKQRERNRQQWRYHHAHR